MMYSLGGQGYSGGGGVSQKDPPPTIEINGRLQLYRNTLKAVMLVAYVGPILGEIVQ